jgi:hypothetical protein
VRTSVCAPSRVAGRRVDRVDREPRLDDEQLLRAFAARYPDGSGPSMSLAVCMFTNTWNQGSGVL